MLQDVAVNTVHLAVALIIKQWHGAPTMLDVGVSTHSLVAALTTIHQQLGKGIVAVPATPILMVAAQMVSALPKAQALRVGCSLIFWIMKLVF